MGLACAVVGVDDAEERGVGALMGLAEFPELDQQWLVGGGPKWVQRGLAVSN